MAALETLPMLKKDKETFVDIIINNSNSGGGSKLGYLYFNNIVGDGSYPIATFFEVLMASFSQANNPPIVPIVKQKYMGIIPITNIPGGSGGDITDVNIIRIEKYIPMQNMVPFYDFVEFCIDQKIVNMDKSIINIMKANEITEEEFLEGVEFGVPEI